MLWMYIWMSHYHITAADIGQAFGSYLAFYFYHRPGDKKHPLNYSEYKNKEELNLKAMQSVSENAPSA